MSKLDSLLAQYESLSAAGDDQVSVAPVDKPPSTTRASSKLDDLLSKYGAEPTAAAPEQKPQIYKQNPFVSTVKSTTAGIANALAGQPLEDIGEAVGSKTLQEAGRSVRERMEGVQQENPSEIGSLEDIVKKPGAAVQTALGNLAPQIPLSMGGAYAGAKAGAMLPVPPQLKPITAAGGGILGAFAPNYFQEAAEMRGKQHETGAEDKSKAYLTAIPAAGLETASDVLIAGKFLPKAVKQSAIGGAVGKFAGEGLSETGSRLAHVGKQAAKGVLGEGATEYAQTALEQVGGGQDLSTEESQREREVSAALGAIGGGLVSGGLSTFDKRASEQQPDTEQTETPPQEPPPAPETQDVDNIPVTEDFAEVPTDTAQEPIIVPPESEQTSQDVYEAAAEADAFAENAKFNRLNDFVTQYQAKLDLGGIPTMVGKHLREAAIAAGTYGPKDRPDVVFEKLKAAVEAMKSPEQKIEEAGLQAREKLKDDIAAQYDGKPMGPAGRATTLSIDQGLSPEEQGAKEQKAAELEAEQQSVVDTDTGEVLTETPVTPTLDELVADYLQFPVETLQRQANLSTLTPEQREAIRIAKEQKIAEKEAQDALNQQETGAIYGGGSEQSEIRGEGERTAESGAGVPPEGQTDRNIPTTEEITTEPTIGDANGEGPDETAQTTSQEIDRAENARKLLVSALPSGDLNALTGKYNADNRAALIEALTGTRPAKSKATSSLLRRVFYEAAGVDLNQTIRGQEKQFSAWATQAQEEAATEAELEDAGITQKYPVDFAAHKEAAASRFNGRRELPENRDAQKKAYTEIQGMPIGIENPEGSVRKGKGWENVMKAHYGFFTGVKGADGDQLDLFVKPKLTQDALDNIQSVFVVDQINPSTKIFDEAKVMLGYKSLAAARKAYLENYTKGWRGLGAITEIPLADFKARIETGEAWDSPVAYTQDKTKTPGSRTPPKSTDELQNAIGKLGGIGREIADRSGFSDYKGRKYQYLFNKGGTAKTFDEMAEILRGYGYEVGGENDLIQKLTDSLNGTPFYTPEGFEAFAEYRGQEATSDEESRARNDFLAEVDASNISQDDKDAFREDVLNGDFDSERDYKLLGELIEKAELEEIDNIPGQFSRRAPMMQMDLFADSPGELTALQTKQQVADYAAQKDKKRQGNGAEPPPLFSDYPGFMGQTDIEDTQASLEDTFKAMGKFDKAPEIINHPDAERIRYVQDNFLDLLSELEKRQPSEFEIKC